MNNAITPIIQFWNGLDTKKRAGIIAGAAVVLLAFMLGGNSNPLIGEWEVSSSPRATMGELQTNIQASARLSVGNVIFEKNRVAMPSIGQESPVKYDIHDRSVTVTQADGQTMTVELIDKNEIALVSNDGPFGAKIYYTRLR